MAAVGEATVRETEGEASEREEVEEEETKERGEEGPRDAIRVRVLAYLNTEETFFYTIEVVVNEGDPLVLLRSYEEVRWVHRLLACSTAIGGYILPPLPEAPVALATHLEPLGVPKSSMFGDHTRLACLEIESFLQSLADHTFFSLHHHIHTFLTSPKLPTHEPLAGPSLWDSITSAITYYQLSSIQDSDEEFVELLRSLNERAPVLEACSRDCSLLLAAWQRLACAEMSVCACVKEEKEWEVGRNSGCALSLYCLSNIFSEQEKYNHATSTDGLNTIGFTFDLHHRYNKQAKEMLYRRLEKVQVLINASRQLDKAKPEKKDEMEQVRAEAMRDYDNVNTTAKKEMEDTFSVKWVVETKKSLVDFAESQLTHSRCLMAQLDSIKYQLKGVK